jgi:hypothetical protein
MMETSCMHRYIHTCECVCDDGHGVYKYIHTYTIHVYIHLKVPEMVDMLNNFAEVTHISYIFTYILTEISKCM